MLTRHQAKAQAQEILEALLKSGDKALFDAARRADGSIDTKRLAEAAARAEERIADLILAGKM